MTEGQLQSAVIEAARLLGWRVAHFRPALTKHGWRTAVQGDGKGFPDLVLVRRRRLLVVELKADRGRLSDEQVAWLTQLDQAGCETAVWRPDDWLNGSIDRALGPG